MKIMSHSWIDLLGYSALVINLFSMSMADVAKLRILSIIANSIYVVYGFFLGATPLVVGGSIAVSLHTYRLIQLKRQNRNPDKHNL